MSPLWKKKYLKKQRIVYFKLVDKLLVVTWEKTTLSDEINRENIARLNVTKMKIHARFSTRTHTKTQSCLPQNRCLALFQDFPKNSLHCSFSVTLSEYICHDVLWSHQKLQSERCHCCNKGKFNRWWKLSQFSGVKKIFK